MNRERSNFVSVEFCLSYSFPKENSRTNFFFKLYSLLTKCATNDSQLVHHSRTERISFESIARTRGTTKLHGVSSRVAVFQTTCFLDIETDRRWENLFHCFPRWYRYWPSRRWKSSRWPTRSPRAGKLGNRFTSCFLGEVASLRRCTMPRILWERHRGID